MVGALTFPRSTLNRPFTYLRFEICLDEDWHDSFVINEGAKPMDLTGVRLEWICRPKFDHPALIKKLSSEGSEGLSISIDDVANGSVTFFMFQAAVASTFVPGKWEHFLNVVEEAGTSQPLRQEAFRGDLIVHPGRI